jgi:hypothetical protein
MVDFDNVLCNVYDLHDEELKRLREEISKEIQKREKKRELEAAEKVAKAIQDYLAAGYTLRLEGEVEMPDEDYYADYQSVIGFIESVDLKDNQVTLNFIEER